MVHNVANSVKLCQKLNLPSIRSAMCYPEIGRAPTEPKCSRNCHSSLRLPSPAEADQGLEDITIGLISSMLSYHATITALKPKRHEPSLLS